MNRLRPNWYGAEYHQLRQLRKAYEGVVARHVSVRAGDVAGRVMVDYGCGTMPYRPLFEPFIGRYIGADLVTRLGAEVLIDAETGRVALDDASADFVLSSQVLEHVPDPPRYLAEARRLIRPGGRFFLSTHGHYRYHPSPTDFWRWTIDGLRRLVESEGWDVEEHLGVVGLAATGLQLFQDACRPRLPAVLKAPLQIILQRGMQLSDLMTSEESRRRDASVFLLVLSPRVDGERAGPG